MEQGTPGAAAGVRRRGRRRSRRSCRSCSGRRCPRARLLRRRQVRAIPARCPYAGFAQACTALVEQAADAGRGAPGDLARAAAPGARRQRSASLFDRPCPIWSSRFGPQPPPPPLPLTRGRCTASTSPFRRFVAVFARREHPLAPCSSAICNGSTPPASRCSRTSSHTRGHRLPLALARRLPRQPGVTAAHPLMRTLADIRSTGGRCTHVHSPRSRSRSTTSPRSPRTRALQPATPHAAHRARGTPPRTTPPFFARPVARRARRRRPAALRSARSRTAGDGTRRRSPPRSFE